MLSDDLIRRLQRRAADPKTRSDAFESVRETLDQLAPGPRPTRVSMGDAAGAGAFGGMMQLVAGALLSGRGFSLQKMAEQVAEDVRTGKLSREEVFGGAPPGAGIEVYEGEVPAESPRDLAAPPSPQDVAAAEAALGFPLPEDLKQLYAVVANGGFGPSVGFLPLSDLVANYREYRSEPQGPCDETWPAHLLPIVPVDMGDACYDLETGKIVCWDQEELIDEDAEDEAWDRSFKPWADSLADWLETWLSKKSVSEEVADKYQRARADIARNALNAICAMTPEQRAQMGLPDEGWEEQICRNHGVDPKLVL